MLCFRGGLGETGQHPRFPGEPFPRRLFAVVQQEFHRLVERQTLQGQLQLNTGNLRTFLKLVVAQVVRGVKAQENQGL